MSFPWPSSKRQGARKLRNACHAAFKIIHRAFQMSVAWARHKFRCSEQIECSYSSEYAEIGVHRLAEIVEISTDPIRKIVSVSTLNVRSVISAARSIVVRPRLVHLITS